jgi:Tol biopolymer transport system component
MRIALCLAVLLAVVAQASASAGGARRSGWILYWREDPWPSIWALAPDASQGKRILGNTQNAKRPRLSPDRSWVAFDGTPPGKRVMSDFDIQLVHLDGTGLHTVTDAAAWDTDAQWSPDGEWLSFTRTPPSPMNCNLASVWIVRVDGTGSRRVANGCGARWSPDGRRLVYSSRAGPLFVVRVGGGKPRRVRGTRASDAAAGWSSRGILFSRTHDRNGHNADVFVTNAAGTRVRRLGSGFAAAWSPSGAQILYTTSFFSALWVMNADGSRKHRIADVSGAAEPDWR